MGRTSPIDARKSWDALMVGNRADCGCRSVSALASASRRGARSVLDLPEDVVEASRGDTRRRDLAHRKPMLLDFTRTAAELLAESSAEVRRCLEAVVGCDDFKGDPPGGRGQQPVDSPQA